MYLLLYTAPAAGSLHACPLRLLSLAVLRAWCEALLQALVQNSTTLRDSLQVVFIVALALWTLWNVNV